MKNSPTVTPTKSGEQREREVGQFEDNLWYKVCCLPEERLVVDEDEDCESVDLFGAMRAKTLR